MVSNGSVVSLGVVRRVSIRVLEGGRFDSKSGVHVVSKPLYNCRKVLVRVGNGGGFNMDVDYMGLATMISLGASGVRGYSVSGGFERIVVFG